MKKQKLVVMLTVLAITATITLGFDSVQAHNKFQNTDTLETLDNIDAEAIAINTEVSGNSLPSEEATEEVKEPAEEAEEEVKEPDNENAEEVREAEMETEQTIAKEEEPASAEENIVIAQVTNYINVRRDANEESEVVGKLYNNSAGILLGEKDGWYNIESGHVTGYVKTEFVLTGEEALKKAEEIGIRMARVITQTLKVREEPSIEAKVIGLVPEGDLLAVNEETDGFVGVSVEEGNGFVSIDYVEVYTENVVAESTADEAERLRKEEEERQSAKAAAKASIDKRNSEASESKKKAVQPAENKAPVSEKPAVSTGAMGKQIADFAVRFVGNPYVYGGTSLTQGADCSGFVLSVYANFGISLPRTSGAQGKSGSSVPGVDSAQPGDLVWYSGHIGIYMGNGQLVHASNAKEGIKISNVNYRPILGIRRIV